MTAFEELMAFSRDTEALAQIAGRLGWDQETMMPRGAATQRGDEMAAIEAVLHYSARSARAFVAAVQAAGVEITALALPQCCISEAVASVLRDDGATQVAVAHAPDEDAMLAALARALPPSGADA